MVTSDAPRVSVLMPVRNGGRFLAEAISSVLGQTMSDFELIVVDDGSTDGTREALRAIATSDPRVIVLENEHNLGIPATLNRGLALCRSPLVARADADDVCLPTRLAEQLDYLDRHPQIGLLGTNYVRIDAEGNELGGPALPAEDPRIRIRQLFLNTFLHGSVVFRVDPVRQIGAYDVRYWTAQDSDLWARLRPHTRFANLPGRLVRYRVHDHSVVRTRGGDGAALSLTVPQRLLSEYLGRTLEVEEAHAIVKLYQSSVPLEPPAAARGLTGLADVLRRANDVEDDSTVQYYRRQVAAGLLRQARFQAAARRPIARRLLAEAFRWAPAVPLRRPVKAARVLLPIGLRPHVSAKER